MKKTIFFISSMIMVATTSHAAPVADTSWISGLAASSSEAAEAENPWDPQLASDQEKLFGQPTPADQENLETAINSSRNEEGLKRAGEESAKKLSQGQGTDEAQKSFSIFQQSIVSPSGQITTQSYGCAFRRTASSDLVYKPWLPEGSQISNHSITPDDPGGCASEFIDGYGATCQLQSAEASCQVADNTRIVYGEMSAYNVRTGEYENWPADKVNALQTCGNLSLSGQQGNLVTNGGFENPIIGSGDWGYFNGSIFGWAGSLIEIQNNHNGRIAVEGSQYAELNSEGFEPTISQTIATTPGTTYSVSFLHRPHSSSSETVRVRIAGIDVNLSGGDTNAWNRVSVPFTATGYSSVLVLSPSYPISGKYGNFIDDVRVSADYCKKVPEIIITPEVGLRELGPLWAGDGQAEVCWVAGINAECTLDTKVADPAIEEMARQIGQQDGVDQKYLELFGQCTTTNVSNTNTADLEYATSEYCTTDLEPKFEACNVQRRPRLQSGTINFYEDSWSGDARCTKLVNEYPNWESTCTASVNKTSSDCVIADGVEICSCSKMQSKYGVTLSACNPGQIMVTNSLAASVPGISSQSVGMCVAMESQNTPPEPPIPAEFEACQSGYYPLNYGGSDVCVRQYPSKPKATCGPYNDILNSGLPYGIEAGKLVKSVGVSEVNCPPYDIEECTGSGDCYNPALYAYDCNEFEVDPKCSLAETNCEQEFEHPLGTYCGITEQKFSCNVDASAAEEYTKEVVDCGENGMFDCVDDTCFDYTPEQDDGFAEATARLSIVNSMVDDMFCTDPDDMTTCEIFAGSEMHCSYGNGLGSLLYGCCPGHEALLNPFTAIYSAAQMMTKALDMIADRVPAALTDLTGLAIVAPPGTYIGIVASKEQTKAYVSISQTILDNVPNWLVNQCSEEAALIISHAQNEPDIEVMHYGGRYCTRNIAYGFGTVCVAKRMNYCVYNTAFAKIVMDAASTQFGMDRAKYGANDPMDCSGITIGELQQLDWSRVDTQKLAGMMANTGNMPPNLSHQFGVGNINVPTSDPTDIPSGWQ